ncbi:hypothetical protein ACGGZK_13880 [Agromyces sp. MMS24-K17]|uniref:hypothetical protein n=1 Tax=Agromyces sp. MMS24-K17 TaxID=3372850 RepID=UPI0037542946
MVAVRFACGHGAPEGQAVTLRRGCPVCMLVQETRRSRSELLGRVMPAERARLAAETKVGATYDWRCSRGHDRYTATVLEVLTGSGCAKCRAAATAPAARPEAGVPFLKPGLRVGTSATEHRLKAMLGARIRLNHRVNAIHIAGLFHGRREVWPDIIVPPLRIVVEYDDPGRTKLAHRGLSEASDLEKDDLLRDVGWEVIRIRAAGLGPIGPHHVVCARLTESVADEVVAIMRTIRGGPAVDAIAIDGRSRVGEVSAG